MRVCLLAPGGVDRTGCERVIPALLALVERLARRHPLVVVALDQEPEPCTYPLLGARIINLGRPRLRVPGAAHLARWRRLRRMIRGEPRFDLVHALWAGQPATLGLALARKQRTPFLVSIGGGEFAHLPEIGYGGRCRLTSRLQIDRNLRGASVVTAGSRYAAGLVSGVRDDVEPLPLGVDRAIFDGPLERPPGPPWRILHVAGINRVKAPEVMLAALRAIVDAESACTLDWVGFDTLNGEIHRRAEEVGLTGHIRFHGVLPNREVAQLARGAHLYIQTSHHESQCVAVSEAALAGTPTVATRVGIIPELAPTAAVAVDVGDADALAREVLSLLPDEIRRLSIASAARDWARTHDADWTADRFEEIYTRLTRRDGGADGS